MNFLRGNTLPAGWYLASALFIHTSAFSQWTQTGGPEGAFTQEIVKVNSILLVSTETGQIYSSDNNGDSWNWSSSGLPCNENVYALAEDNGIAYAAVSRSGVYRSDNNGQTWTPANSGIENFTFYSLFAEGGKIYAGYANGGIYYSEDQGKSWVNKSSGLNNSSIAIFESYNGKIYAGGSSLFETSNNGDTWTKIDIPGLFANGIKSMTAFNGNFYVGDDQHIFISDDNLNSWKSPNLSINATVIHFTHHNGTVFFSTSSGRYFYTNDDGANWTMLQNTKTESFAYYLFFSGNKMFMSTYDGIYESVDSGTTWTLNNSGLKSTKIGSLSANSDFLFAGTDWQGLFRSSDQGQSWSKINYEPNPQGPTSILDILTNQGNILTSTYQGIYYSNSNGLNWTKTFTGSAQALSYSDGTYVAAVNGSGVYLSPDGSSWTLAANSGLKTNTGYLDLLKEGPVIMVSTGDGEIFISEDSGSNWKNISIPGTPSLAYDLEISGNTIYAATTRGIKMSNDLGKNWSSFGNYSQTVNDIIVEAEYIYAGTGEGFYVFSIDGKKMQLVCDGLGKQTILSLTTKGGDIFAGTFAKAVWKISKEKVDAALNSQMEPGNIQTINLCSNSDPVDLFQNLEGSPESGGTWSPSLNNSGLFDPAKDPEGIYTYTTNEVCGCGSTSKIKVTINEGGSEAMVTDLSICANSGEIDLFENLSGAPEPGGTWTPTLSSGTDIFNPDQDPAGTYTYMTEKECSTKKYQINISLGSSSDFKGYSISTANLSAENSITIKLNSTAEFEFSIDGINYQKKNVFSNLSPGSYMVSGREINGCQAFQTEVSIIGFPDFFTPNNDGYHDRWQLFGDIDKSYAIYIFDRYGKLLKELNEKNPYWDGSFNGYPMPSDDYWYKIIFEDGTINTGHFSLLR